MADGSYSVAAPESSAFCCSVTTQGMPMILACRLADCALDTAELLDISPKHQTNPGFRAQSAALDRPY